MITGADWIEARGHRRTSCAETESQDRLDGERPCLEIKFNNYVNFLEL